MEIEGEPYTKVPGTEFDWWRSQMLGGRTNHWGRISSFRPKDFKHKSHDGLSDDWPISYDDVKPYYDKVDKLIGVLALKRICRMSPMDFSFLLRRGCMNSISSKVRKKWAFPVIPSRLSILTKKINEARGVCFYCGQCNRGCSVYADFSAGTCLIFPAQKSGGKIDLFVNSMVREVLTDKEGKATGVSYINKEDRQEYELKGKIVVLAASACSSAAFIKLVFSIRQDLVIPADDW
jgi:choline dehydrogenase-like flavoprotein